MSEAMSIVTFTCNNCEASLTRVTNLEQTGQMPCFHCNNGSMVIEEA